MGGNSVTSRMEILILSNRLIMRVELSVTLFQVYVSLLLNHAKSYTNKHSRIICMLIKYSRWEMRKLKMFTFKYIYTQRYTSPQLWWVYNTEHFPNRIQLERFSHFEQSFFIKFSIHFKHFHIPSRKLDIILHKFCEYWTYNTFAKIILIFMYSGTKTSFSSSVMVLLLN